MKSMKQTVKILFGASTMMILILDAGTALNSASEGISLCIWSVIPSLYPFLVLSIYLTGNLPRGEIPLLRPIGKLCKLSPGSEGILLTGLLGGYPVGAQAVTQAWEAGQIETEEAHRMLGFCNNAGPAFLFGMLSPLFHNTFVLWILWGIQIISALLTGMLLPSQKTSNHKTRRTDGISLPNALQRALRVMASICGWVIMFRILIGFLERWIFWKLPETVQILFSGLLELTNGCVRLSDIENEGLRFLLASLFLCLGGLCVGMQSVSVTGKLGTVLYFPGKVLQCGVSTLLCALILPVLYPGTIIPWLIPVSMAAILGSALFLKFRKNNSSIFQLQGV